MDRIDTNKITQAIRRPITLRVISETGSTNDDLKAAARAGAEDHTLLIAEKQTGGRGREGRRFFSASGLYMSLLLPWREDSRPFLTPLAAVAVAQAIKSVTGKNAEIKWVNDVFCDGKKVCGILTESVIVGDSRRLVLGIGVNADTPAEDFPDEIKKIAGTVSCDRSELAAAILNRFYELFDAFSVKLVRNAYRELCFTLGSRVAVLCDGKEREGTAVGLDDSLALIVRYEDGKEERLISGEVSIRPALSK